MRSATPFAALVASLAVALSWCGGIAHAAGVFTVSGVRVDVTAPAASDARSAGYSAAQAVAFDRLVKRLTIPSELARIGSPAVSGAALDPLVANVEVQEERPTGARYIGRLTVNFDPSMVRKTLRDNGLTVVETRSAPVLVVPQYSGPADGVTAWQTAWTEGGFSDELAPVAIPQAPIAGAPDWQSVQGAAASAGAARAIFATARPAGSQVAVTLTEVAPNGARRALGTITAAVGPTDFSAAARAANDVIQNEWKAGLASTGGQKDRMTVSAYYTSQSEWVRIKQGLEGASRTVLSGISIEAVSRDAALVSFGFVGSRDQLAAELLRHGITITDTPTGPALRLRGGA